MEFEHLRDKLPLPDPSFFYIISFAPLRLNALIEELFFIPILGYSTRRAESK